jgi:hypothetical protein
LNVEARTSVEKDVLKITDVNFNVEENSKRHRTDQYELTQWRTGEDGKTVAPLLVARRGDPFDILIKLDRPYDVRRDDLKLVFTTGNHIIHYLNVTNIQCTIMKTVPLTC